MRLDWKRTQSLPAKATTTFGRAYAQYLLAVQRPLVQEEIESLEELAQFQPIWVDLESPTLEEKRWVKQHYGLSIPDDAMDLDIEESARLRRRQRRAAHPQ